MAKKRKSTATEPTRESEPVQTTEPEPEPKPVEEPDVEEEDPIEQEEYEGGDEQEEAVEEEVQGDPNGASSSEPCQKENPQIDDPKPGENGGDEELVDETIESLLEPFSKEQLTLLIKEAVDANPNFIKNVHKAADADPAHCKIFIHGLGWEANTETITKVFGKYGEIQDCKVVKDKNTGKSKGYGFILYKSRLGAKRALKEPQKLIDGRMASCQLASAGPVQNPAQQQQQQKPNVVANPNQPTVSEYTQRKIYISNVSADLDIKKLSEFFSKFGEIEEGPLGLDKQTGKPRGFCLFVYKSVESARRALEEPHKNFEGHILHCQKAVDGPKHGKGLIFNQPHGLGQPQPQPQPQQQSYYGHSAKKGRYAGTSGVGHAGGHLMAPSGPPMPSVGFNPAVAPAIGQAVAALLATQGAGLGIGNLLGGVNPQGMINNAGYGAQAGAYGGQPGIPGPYGGQAQMGQGVMRPHQGGGGAPYMGHGH